jgi:hypothetical protein
MNRRQFLKTLLAGVVGSTLDIESTVDRLLQQTASLSDTDFIVFITFQFNLLVDNPRACVIITNIGLDE